MRSLSFATMVGVLGLLVSLVQAAALPRALNKVISTPHGDVTGLTTADGSRYTVPYVRPPVGGRRFKDPVDFTQFAFPSLRRSYRRSRTDRKYDASKLPPACPQTHLDEYSEDCLYLTIYAPPSASPTSNLPVFFWVHGGSFHSGATSDLDAAALARSQNMVVVEVQYRLGLLGWARFDKMGVEGNLGLKDVIKALQFVQSDISAYGGSPSLVTLAGQSSGAEIIKSLLVTPSATPLFKRAILQSAPLDTVDQSISTANKIGQHALVELVKCRTLSCLQNSRSVEDILAAQATLLEPATVMSLGSTLGLGPDYMFSEPFRTVVDGKLVTRDFRQVVRGGGQLEGRGKELVFTTVKDEGCATIAGVVPTPVAADAFPGYVAFAFPSRAADIVESGLYDPSLLANDSDATRDQLVRLVTDFSWVCPNQKTALGIEAAGGHNVYLGEFDLGVDFYEGGLPFCSTSVDHQDDIYLLFSPPSPLSSAQSTLSRDLQARWGAFAHTGQPNARGASPRWPTVGREGEGEMEVMQLGGARGGRSRVVKGQRGEECAAYRFA
ncbi:hypothetical protein JCM8097_007988 [Rhodosporidiobolus ruineniae]